MDAKAGLILAAAAALLLCVKADTCGNNNMMGSCIASAECGWCVGLNMTSCVAGDATGPSSADHCCYAYSHQLAGVLKEDQKCPEMVSNKPALKTDGGSVVVGAMDDVVFEITGQRPISINGLDMRVDEAKKLAMDTDANTVMAIAKAKQEAIDSAATNATSKATTAKQEAIDAAATDATTKAATAKQEAIEAAAKDATAKSATAKQEAIDTAATDATTKAATAKQEAIEAAATDATAKSATAKQEAIDAAATDATTKAATAKQEAIDVAAIDASTKANTAKQEAIEAAAVAKAGAMTYTDDTIDDLVDTSRVLNGTLEAQVDLLIASHAQALRDIASLRAVVTELEDIGVFPKSCKDLYFNMFSQGVTNIPSQVYPIYPLGNASSRIYAFCEMHLSLSGQENLALGKNTWQTTTTNDAPSSRLVDGNPSGQWASGSCNHGASESDAVWYVDLGDLYQVNRVVITNRQDCCGGRLNNFEIRLSRKWDESLGRSDPECRPGELLQQSGKFTVQCSNLVDARYLSIHLPGSGRTLNLCEVEVYGKDAKLEDGNQGGWTLIASGKAGESYPDNLKTLYGTTPKAEEFGVLEYFFTNDLTTLGTELYVVNEAGETHYFQLDQFKGPLVVDSANMVDTADHGHFGLLTGNDYPVVQRYQVGTTCGTSDDCRKAIGRDEKFSTGILFYLDWNYNEAKASLSQHASFGGTDKLADVFSHRGTMLYIR